MPVKTLFNDHWKFLKFPLNTSLTQVLEDVRKWMSVDIPHDWLIYNTLDLYEDGEGWYRKSFVIDDVAYQRIQLRFDGVYMDSTIYVNGKQAGEWKYGYTTFEVDISPYLQQGENQLWVQVRHQAPNSRWYSGAGIYRNVWLKRTGPSYLISDGIYISTEKIENEQWKIMLDSEIHIDQPEQASKESWRIIHHLYDPQGQEILSGSKEYPADLQEKLADHQVLTLEKPRVWDIEDPVLYMLKTELYCGEQLMDSEEQTFGFRSIDYRSDSGFWLNGRHLKLNGVCQHHDLGCLGAAVNKTALGRQFKILREMGVNAVRTAHNMPAVELMELADETGMLICSEAFDMWENPKTTYDYARFFNDWHQRDVAQWIRRDRNRPSVIMWSIGNEIADTHLSERGLKVTRNLIELVQKHDPRENAPVTIGSNFMPWPNARKCADLVKLAGYNYAESYYEEHHQKYPDWIIYGSETSSIVQSRGIYHFPAATPILADDDLQCSSLGNSTTSWGARSIESCITEDRDMPFSAGQFLWTGFDYLGEPTPYHTKNSYFGQIDTCGFPKDAFYMYQAAWTDYRAAPMVHIFPYWDFNQGQLIDLQVCSNAPRIELFFNGDSLGSVDIDQQKGKELVGRWQIPYKTGELKALAYDEKGQVIAEDVRRSFGDAVSIAVSADKEVIRADGRDLVFLEITARDSEGNPVDNAVNSMEVKVSGAGRLIGLDNGDSTDYSQMKGTVKRLFSGKLLAVVAAKLEPGEISIEIASPGLKTACLNLKAMGCEKPEGITALEENSPSCPEISITPRKIELHSPEGQLFTESKPSMKVRAEILPPEASVEKIIWRVTNEAGIDSNIAKIEARGCEAHVTALGDGTFRIRSMAADSEGQIRLISQLEYKAEGLGPAYFDPYGFVSAGLYTDCDGELTNGNQRGISTPREKSSRITFHGLDFGNYGSDEITLPIFELENRDFEMQIWEGIPGEEDSELLADVVYNKPSQWNVYQEESYRLSRRLKGISTLSLVAHRKAHIKGFSFKRLEKAFQKLEARENDSLYGDTFCIAENAIEGIGNNVTLVFDEMDFGAEGCRAITLCGRSPIEKNSIRIQFQDQQGQKAQTIDFPYTENYQEMRFPLEAETGMKEVHFIFLPGSNFDFKWFRFEKK